MVYTVCTKCEQRCVALTSICSMTLRQKEFLLNGITFLADTHISMQLTPRRQFLQHIYSFDIWDAHSTLKKRTFFGCTLSYMSLWVLGKFLIHVQCPISKRRYKNSNIRRITCVHLCTQTTPTTKEGRICVCKQNKFGWRCTKKSTLNIIQP